MRIIQKNDNTLVHQSAQSPLQGQGVRVSKVTLPCPKIGLHKKVLTPGRLSKIPAGCKKSPIFKVPNENYNQLAKNMI